MRTTASSLAVLVTVVAALAACDPPPVACTEEARASVTVSVVDSTGAAVNDATVVFTVDGGAEEACESLTGTGYVCGYERSGSIVVTARKVGFVDASGSVDVGLTDDGCHVEGETLTLTLQPS